MLVVVYRTTQKRTTTAQSKELSRSTRLQHLLLLPYAATYILFHLHPFRTPHEQAGGTPPYVSTFVSGELVNQPAPPTYDIALKRKTSRQGDDLKVSHSRSPTYSTDSVKNNWGMTVSAGTTCCAVKILNVVAQNF